MSFINSLTKPAVIKEIVDLKKEIDDLREALGNENKKKVQLEVEKQQLTSRLVNAGPELYRLQKLVESLNEPGLGDK